MPNRSVWSTSKRCQYFVTRQCTKHIYQLFVFKSLTINKCGHVLLRAGTYNISIFYIISSYKEVCKRNLNNGLKKKISPVVKSYLLSVYLNLHVICNISKVNLTDRSIRKQINWFHRICGAIVTCSVENYCKMPIKRIKKEKINLIAMKLIRNQFMPLTRPKKAALLRKQ